jgi:two-component system LytT family response regulator
MQTEIRVVIVDDEALARRRLRRLCEAAPDLKVVAEAVDGVAALAELATHRPDLVFLDVQMPEPSGFRLLERLGPERPPSVVFVTAHSEHAVQAFAEDAVDYLLKPFDAERFEQTLRRVRTRLAVPTGRASAGPEIPSRLPVRVGQSIRFVDLAELVSVEAEGNYVTLRTASGSHLVRETMCGMEAQLDPALFLRVHRRVIVRLDTIEEMQGLPGGECVLRLRDGTTMTSGRTYRARLVRALGLRSPRPS